MRKLALVGALCLVLFFGTGAFIETKIRMVYAVQPEFGMALASGWLANTWSTAGTVNKFGRNEDADTTEDSIADISDLGGPIRCFTNITTSVEVVNVTSDSDSDAALGVTVEFIDGSWDKQTEALTLGADAGTGTAQSLLNSGTGVLRINRAFATSTALTGNIYLHTDTDAGVDGIPDTLLTDIVAVITAGQNQTLQACYTVPNGMVALLTQFCTTNINKAANATATFRLRKSVAGAASRVQEVLEIGESIYQCTEHDPPIVFVEKTDIELTSVMSGNDGAATGTFDLLVVPEL